MILSPYATFCMGLVGASYATHVAAVGVAGVMSALHLPRVSCFCLICANLEVDARFPLLPSGKVFKGDDDDDES